MFFLGLVVWFLVAGASAVWWLRAQYEYFRLYKAKRDPTLPMWGELPREFRLFPPGAPYTRIMSEAQDDPELEGARRLAIHRQNVSMIVAFAGVLIPVLFHGIGLWLARRGI